MDRKTQFIRFDRKMFTNRSFCHQFYCSIWHTDNDRHSLTIAGEFQDMENIVSLVNSQLLGHKTHGEYCKSRQLPTIGHKTHGEYRKSRQLPTIGHKTHGE